MNTTYDPDGVEHHPHHACYTHAIPLGWVNTEVLGFLKKYSATSTPGRYDEWSQCSAKMPGPHGYTHRQQNDIAALSLSIKLF